MLFFHHFTFIEELCEPSPCGANTKCDVVNGIPTCSCLLGFYVIFLGNRLYSFKTIFFFTFHRANQSLAAAMSVKKLVNVVIKSIAMSSVVSPLAINAAKGLNAYAL
jgi:hypothetical protein